MTRYPFHLILALFSWLATVGVAWTQAPAQGKVDPFGQLLPSGALSRMGSAFFRHEGEVRSVALSPDNKLLAVGEWDSVKLWQVSPAKLLRTFVVDKQGNKITHLNFSPDGKILAAGALHIGHRRDTLWEVETGKQIERFGGPLSSVVFSPDGKWIAAQNELVFVWDLATGQIRHKLKGHTRGVVDAAFSPDGKKLITMSWIGNIRYWDTETGKQTHFRDYVPWGVGSAMLSPDGRWVTRSGLGSCLIYEALTGKQQHYLVNKGSFLAFSSDGKKFATGSQRRIRWFDSESGKELGQFPVPTYVKEPAAFSKDGKSLAVIHMPWNGSRVHIWDLTKKNKATLGWHDKGLFRVAFSPDGKSLFSSSWDGTIRKWEVASGNHVSEVGEQTYGLRKMALSPDGKIMATLAESRLRLLDVASGKEKRSTSVGSYDAEIGFTRDGKHLIFTGKNLNVHVMEVATGMVIRKFESKTPYLCISPDGKTLATTNQGQVGQLMASGTKVYGPVGPIRLWDVASGQERIFWQTKLPSVDPLFLKLGVSGQPRGPWPVVFSPDGRLIGWVGNKKIQMYEVSTVLPFTTFHDKLEGRFFRFSPDGQTLAVVTDKNNIELWEVATGQRKLKFQGQEGQITCLAFSPDGKRLAAGSDTTTILVWDLPTLGLPQGAIPRKLTAQDLEKLWKELKIVEAAPAHSAMSQLLTGGGEVLPFLEKQLKDYQPSPETVQIPKLLQDLNAEKFAVREKAYAQLKKLGGYAKPALHAALQEKVKHSLEFHLRVKKLLQELQDVPSLPPPQQLQVMRAIIVLEQIGTPAARELLERLAKDHPEFSLRQQAQAALARLNQMTSK